MIRDEVIRDLTRQSEQGLELDPSLVLADALLETDRPDLGEDLVLVLSTRRPFPRDQRGQPLTRLVDRERALKTIFRRIHRRFAWSKYDEDARKSALRELNEIATDWNESDAPTRRAMMGEISDWLEGTSPVHDNVVDDALYERASWLLDGQFGRGAQILGEEVLDEPSRFDRAAQLFRLVLAFDDRAPAHVSNRIWRQLTLAAKEPVVKSLRQVLVEHGSYDPAPSRPARSRRKPR